ncbi:hypothetical protein CDL12_04714 [Handroanthus impetiginosus]|uniref:Bifunctional inhibitor/plant lipid transfer protein/seed storage helical domain-containing protein n=1 Tax=Handroanthus impetiginosus TaxID=429701 RepID=A0A2G9HYG3_9LAMI|nr:hypothetical protein CDL12_04714 [Handroanthus impetiginosus]
MNHALHILLLLLHSLTLTASASASSAADPPRSAACSDELVTFSTCLPYVAVSPNNLTDSPPPQCCDDVSAAFGNDSAICLCYFVVRPEILGFPLNSTKLFSLTSVCPVKDQNSMANFSLETLCSGSAALPPLHSIRGPRNSEPRNFEAISPPPPLMGSAQGTSDSSPTEEPADDFPSQPSSSNTPTTISSATERIYSLSQSLLSFSVYIVSSL